MRSIGIVTTSRADYSSLLPILREINNAPDLRLQLFVGGMHLAHEYGFTVRQIDSDGFDITDRIDMQVDSGSQESVARSMGLGVIGFGGSFARHRPDILLMVGDRFELLSAACAALPLGIPVAHISGGDITEGAIDNQVRHAITKLSHVHFVAMEAHAERVVQMGEEPSRVVVTGDPALDLIRQMEFLKRSDLSRQLGLELQSPVVLVSIHPTTLGSTSVTNEVESILGPLSRIQGTLILTYPNSDYQSDLIIDRIREFVASHPQAGLYANLGQVKYYSLLAQADLMVGNSSSGIWEAPSFRLPVVNVGDRQRGRLRAGNVIDVRLDADSIYSGIQRGLDPSFRASLEDLQNPYGDGEASPRILSTLQRLELGPQLLQKSFVDQPIAMAAGGSGVRPHG